MADLVAAPGPRTSVDPQVEARLGVAGRFFRWIAVLYAVVVLVGTVIEPLSQFPPGPSLVRRIPVASAGALTLLSFAALFAGDLSAVSSSRSAWRRIGLALSFICAGFGGFVVYEFATNNFEVWPETVGIPAFSVGLILVVLGLSIPLSVSRVDGRVVAGQVGALLTFSLAAVIFLGYAYGDPSVGRLFLTPVISFQATLMSVLIAVGILLIRPSSGLLSTAASPGAGGRLLRWFGPVVLLMPALLLLITELVPSTERVDVLAFVSVGLGLFLLILLSFFVKALDQTAIEVATLTAEAERAKTGLEQEAPVVSGMTEMFHLVDVDGLEGWEVATRFRPGRGAVAGDSSAVSRLPDGAIGAVLVDLTGHGADPAVWAIRLRDLLLQSMMAGKEPNESMALVGWSVPDDILASAIVLKIDSNGRGRLCSAGHPPAILVKDQEAEMKSPTGPLLNLEHSTLYEEHTFEMEPGEVLVAFSDGVADVQLLDNGLTQPERLAELLASERGTAARTADVVLGFADPEPGDDQSVVVIRREL